MVTQENIPYTADEIKAMVKTCEKYNKALETVQEILSSGVDAIRIKTLKLRLQSVFPELKEDERNIKNLIDELKYSLRAAICQNNACGGGHEKRIALLKWGIAWLEKQGKQKPTDDAKKLDPDKVIEWLRENVPMFWEVPCSPNRIIDKFKGDFGL